MRAPAQADRRRVRRAEGKGREAATGRSGRSCEATSGRVAGLDRRQIERRRPRATAPRSMQACRQVAVGIGHGVPPHSSQWLQGCSPIALRSVADGLGRHRRSHGHEAARQNGEAAQEGGEGAKALHALIMRQRFGPAKNTLVTCPRWSQYGRSSTHATLRAVAARPVPAAAGKFPFWPSTCRSSPPGGRVQRHPARYRSRPSRWSPGRGSTGARRPPFISTPRSRRLRPRRDVRALGLLPG